MYAIGTAILIVGAIISYFQWRTAQQKVALDLFDSRYEIYEDLRKIVTEFMGNLEFNNELQRSYLYAQNRARFYFGAEVEDYLEMLRIDMMRGHYFDRFADRQAVNVNEQVARLDRIAAFYNEIIRCSFLICATISACRCGGGQTFPSRTSDGFARLKDG